MRRREFIALLGSGLAGWPLAARAQQGERVRHIGVLMNLSAADDEASPRVTALAQELQQLGWTAGRCGSTTVGARSMPTAVADTRRNCSRSHRTSSVSAAKPR